MQNHQNFYHTFDNTWTTRMLGFTTTYTNFCGLYSSLYALSIPFILYAFDSMKMFYDYGCFLTATTFLYNLFVQSR